MSTTTDSNTDGSALTAVYRAPTPQQPVDRKRRFQFVTGVVGICLGLGALFASFAAFGIVAAPFAGLIDNFIAGMVSLATATTIAYIGGSVVDYNGGFSNMFSRTPNSNGARG